MIPLFVWADPAETTFVEATHAREDEDVFAFELTQSEGDFAQLSVTLRNPRAGFLRPDRKQWAWLSARMPDSSIIPLFFGRLIGVPSNVFGELVTIEFVARPADFLARKTALADALRVLPHPEPALRLAQQQQAGVRRLIATGKIKCELLAPDRWKLERKQRIVGHGGCGGGMLHNAIRVNNDLLRESLASCHSRLQIPHRHE
jgi:hypothetical protein